MITVNNTLTLIAIASLLLCNIGNTSAQTIAPAKNFAGPYIGVGFSNTSAFAGVSYERLWQTGKRIELGVKGNYTTPYRYGNMVLLFGDYSYYRVSETGLRLTGYQYLHPAKTNTGFFLSLEGGATIITWKSPEASEQWIKPVFGTGFGWKWELSDKCSLRLSNILSAQQLPMSKSNMIAMTSTLAVGF